MHYSTTRTNIGKRVSISPSPLHKLPHVPATLYLNTDRERTARGARDNPTKSLQRAVFSCQESPSRSASFPFRFGILSATRARRSLTISERKTKISEFETEKCHIWLAMNSRFRLRGEDRNFQKIKAARCSQRAARRLTKVCTICTHLLLTTISAESHEQRAVHFQFSEN